MNGVSRGARVWAVPDGEPVAVIVLDKGPEGWWVSVENQTTRGGHARVEQIPARLLFPTRGAASAALQGKT